MSFYIIYLVIILIGIFLIGMILNLLIHKKLSETNAILWLCIGFIIILAGLFPKLVVRLSKLFFITYPPALIFTIAIVILLFIVLKNSILISELTAKLQDVATETSILRQELEEIKKKNAEAEDIGRNGE